MSFPSVRENQRSVRRELGFRFAWVPLLTASLAVACVPARPASDASARDRASEDADVASTAGDERAARRAVQASGVPAVPTLGPERPPAHHAERAASGPTLDRARLVREVLARNPSVEARRAAWRAARSKQRQVDTLDDPMLGYEIAPLSVFSGMRVGQTVKISQRFPWPGKLSSAAESEERAAAATGQEIKISELDLALEASLLYDDYWLVERSFDVSNEHRHHLQELKQSAEIQYGVGRSTLSDPLQADVELALLDQHDLGLRAERGVIVSRLNALLHRAPEQPLPEPKPELRVALDLPPPSASLQREAVASSPELKKLSARARAAEARARHAERQYYPDVTLMASYSSMFAAIEHQFMVGFETPLPIHRGSRAAAVDEALAMGSEARSESLSVADRIRSKIESERRRIVELIAVVKVYDDRVIPVVSQQLSATRADFSAGKTPFSSVIDVEKRLHDVTLARHATLAELSKRRARLDRALGRMPFGIQKGGAR